LYLFWLFLTFCRWRWRKQWTRLLQHNQVCNIRSLLILIYGPRHWLLHYSGNYDSSWCSFHVAIINQSSAFNAGSFLFTRWSWIHVCSLYLDLQHSKILFVILYYDISTSAINVSWNTYCSSSISTAGRAVRWDLWILEKDKMF